MHFDFDFYQSFCHPAIYGFNDTVVNKRKRFFQGDSFGGGWEFSQSTGGVGIIIDQHGSLFLVSYISQRFFIARGWFRGKQRIKVTVDFNNIKFDNDGK